MRLDSAAADRVTALVLFLLGAASTYGGFVMDRLEVRRIHPASIPGLVPMMLGVALMICAIALFWSARAIHEDEAEAEPVSWSSFAVTALWSGLYALAAVGTVPFAIATSVYIAGFTMWFLWTEREPEAPFGAKTIIAVLGFSVATAIGISTLFQHGFLVRLP